MQQAGAGVGHWLRDGASACKVRIGTCVHWGALAVGVRVLLLVHCVWRQRHACIWGCVRVMCVRVCGTCCASEDWIRAAYLCLERREMMSVRIGAEDRLPCLAPADE